MHFSSVVRSNFMQYGQIMQSMIATKLNWYPMIHWMRILKLLPQVRCKRRDCWSYLSLAVRVFDGRATSLDVHLMRYISRFFYWHVSTRLNRFAMWDLVVLFCIACTSQRRRGIIVITSSIKLIIAQGTNDSLHYVVSTIGSSVPTLLLLKSNQEDARLAVDWDKLLSNSTDEVSLNGAVKLITKMGQQDHPLTAVYLFSQVTLWKLKKHIFIMCFDDVVSEILPWM